MTTSNISITIDDIRIISITRIGRKLQELLKMNLSNY